jgi:hypothetical protein
LSRIGRYHPALGFFASSRACERFGRIIDKASDIKDFWVINQDRAVGKRVASALGVAFGIGV